jgi:hypothetical protein
MPKTLRNALLAAAAVAAVAAVAVTMLTLHSSRSPAVDEASQAPRAAGASPVDVRRARASGARRHPGAGAPDGGGGRPPTRFGEDTPLGDIIAENSRWAPPRPLRLVVRAGEGRSSADARRIAEDARRRFLGGESSSDLIRELSDPPRGVPAELLRRYESLLPDQASPVLEIEGGYAVLFGTPDAPPDP